MSTAYRGWTGRILRRGRFRAILFKKATAAWMGTWQNKRSKVWHSEGEIGWFWLHFCFQTVVDDKIPRNLGLKLLFQETSVSETSLERKVPFEIKLAAWVLNFSMGSYPDTHEKKGNLPSRWPTRLPLTTEGDLATSHRQFGHSTTLV